MTRRPRETVPQPGWPRMILTALVWLILGWLSIVGFMAISGGN